MLKGLAKFGGWRILILDLLRRAAAGSLGTYTYPVYVGVTVPIGTTIGGVALLLQIVLRKKMAKCAEFLITWLREPSLKIPLPHDLEYLLPDILDAHNIAARALGIHLE